jgi:hypothetical protein
MLILSLDYLIDSLEDKFRQHAEKAIRYRRLDNAAGTLVAHFIVLAQS